MVTTRRNAASVEPPQPTQQRGPQRKATAAEPAKKRGRRGKAAVAQTESRAEAGSQSITKVNGTARVASSSATAIVSTVTASKRVTRAERAAGAGSPFRSYEQPKRQTERKRKRTNGQTASQTPEPEPTPLPSTQDDHDEEPGMFFSDSEPKISSPFLNNICMAVTETTENRLRNENSQLRARVTELETFVFERDSRIYALEDRITDLEDTNARLSDRYAAVIDRNINLELELESHMSQHVSQPSLQATTPHCNRISEQDQFDHDIMQVEEVSPQPIFINGSESALALLHKIEKAAKETVPVEPSILDDTDMAGDANVTNNNMDRSSLQSISNASAERLLTPARPVASPSSFFSRSISALKSKFGFVTSTPLPPPSPQPVSPVPSALKPLPPSNTFTEALSIPPTPVGQRTSTPCKKKTTDSLLTTLLKGIEPSDKAKAEEWAKRILPKLKNDPAFLEKRKRLETPVLMQDLAHYPSGKPWETGFSYVILDLDDEDVVPTWAVYLDMVAAEEEHQSKKRKSIHAVNADEAEIPSINEQFAASNGVHSAPKLYDSHGRSASLYDFHPRRSIEPSPMFDSPVSHQQGANVFSELQGHDASAKMRADERESLQTSTKQVVQAHNPSMGSFSVPDDSDDEDTTMNSDTSDTNGAPLWTQPPPPAPVPAHAPLPGGPVSDAPAVPAIQQPVDEVERQRQKLMKHTPAKPSRLREATYPSPSLLSDAGNESMLAGTPAHLAASMASIFSDMPTAEPIELDEEVQAAFDKLINSEEYKQQAAANPWTAPILAYESDSEELSPE